MAKAYKLIADSAADKFHQSRAKIRMYAGGFANGKTTALVAETLKVIRDYPGANILLARATFPKLNDTLRKEFFNWCPPSWIKSFNKNDNVATFVNGCTVVFRYLDEQRSSSGESTSNLLSANYDFIVVDQIEDPEITEHTFMQLMGRLRGQAEYAGVDDTMPRTGPRMMILTCNPTLGWVYKRMVKPYHDYHRGVHNPDLIAEVDSDGKHLLVDGKPVPIIEIFEASTYDNAQNLGADYIKGLEATYSGKMRDRYLLGKWVAFDGVVYDEFDPERHVIPSMFLYQHIRQLRLAGYRLTTLEGYDHGITEPSCYLLGVTDADDFTYIMDGFYEREMGISDQSKAIAALRKKHLPDLFDTSTQEVLADPAIFRRNSMARDTVGPTVAEMFAEDGITMGRGNNNKLNGIIKVKQRLYIQKSVVHPFSGELGSPKLFIADHLNWLVDEFTSYRWKKAKDDTTIDEPVDKDDHGMDTIKYMLSRAPQTGMLVRRGLKELPGMLRKWREGPVDNAVDTRGHRYK
ncbi:Terminase-like family [uncultured Caudovirales phage]|uniref:Terminase-like family n=1 Tax=uncultured Caudovirales phage TaxID=2100421 RepID=A0A6J5N021_9CAUD|nr:Terminase-like family [uncultured Caudovirales phage]